MTPPLGSPYGVGALACLLREPTLLAFDYDGTLAPICADPANACVDAGWSVRLRRIARRWPVAVISGRSIADVASRLGFEARFIAGNHGAESSGSRPPLHVMSRLDTARTALARQRDSLSGEGVVIEDKGMSLAVHYRNASCPESAAQRVSSFLSGLPDELLVSHGKAVFNITVAAAPDKGDALRCAMRSCRVRQVLYVGDDVSDEPAFLAAKASLRSVTVLVGSRNSPTHARFALSTQKRVGGLLRTLVAWPR